MSARAYELDLFEKIVNGENVKENTELLYISLQPLFNKIIRHIGRMHEYDDLMQEMYFGVRVAIEQYSRPGIKEKYVPHSLIITQCRNRAFKYLYSYYGQTTDSNGKIVANSTHKDALSLDKQYEDSERDLTNFFVSAFDTELDILERETAEEQQKAASILWGEVDKLPPVKRDAIVDYYKKGITHPEKARRESRTLASVQIQCSRTVRALRDNPKIIEIAPYFIPSLAYAGYGFFKSTGTSTTEYIALKKIENQEIREEYRRHTYKLIDPAIMNGKTNVSISKCTGLNVNTIGQLRKQGGVYRDSAEAIARFFGKPFDEMFEILTEAPPKKEAPPKTSFTLVRPEMFNGFRLDKALQERCEEFNITGSTVKETVRTLRNGGRAYRKSAERLADILDRPFDELFVKAA